MAEQLWKGRFSKAVDSRVNDFNSSIRFDQRMIAQDMRGSGVHAAMLARQGNPKAFTFSKPHIPGLDYSFSGLKTSFLYSLRDWMKDDPDFIEHHKVDLAASLEATVVDILMDKLRKAAKEYKIKEVAVAGGVSANNGLRNSFREHAEKYGWNIFIPKFSYTTDNAAMIAITGYFKYLDKDFCSIDLPAYSRVTL